MAVANNFEYITKTLPRVIDKVFAKESYTDALIGKNELKLEFLDAKTVKVYMLASTGLTDYARGGYNQTNKRGAAATTTQKFELSQERYSEIPLDKLDTLDDGETVLGHLASEFVRTKVVYEFDTYRFSKLASYTSVTLGNRVTENISDNTIIANFNNMLEYFSEKKVPMDRIIIYCNPHTMKLIRNTTELAKRLHPIAGDMNKDIQFGIEMYEKCKIVEVPSDMLYTDAVTGDGIYPGASSKVINFIAIYDRAPIIVKKLDHSKIYDSTKQDGSYLGFVGYLFTNLFYHDIFVPENKRVGIYCSVSTTDAATIASTLLVDAVASTESGKTIVKQVFTQPGGMLFDKIYTTNAASRPAIGSSTSALTEVELGAAITPDASHNWFVASLDGKAVAVSKDFTNTLPVGA